MREVLPPHTGKQPAGSTDAHLPARDRQSKDGLAPCLRSFKNLEAIRSAAGRAEEAEASDSRFYSYGSVEARRHMNVIVGGYGCKRAVAAGQRKVQGWITILIAAIALLIGYFQWVTAHQRVVIDLFEKRLRLFNSIELAIGADAPEGMTEALMMAHGFNSELLVDLCIAGLAIAKVERMIAGGRTVEVVRSKITEAGRQALTVSRGKST
jgi:hypothetical protein